MDSAIVVLMSHGEHDVIMGTDDGKVNVHDLLRSLNQNAPGLRGKPKIFIVQACRGGCGLHFIGLNEFGFSGSGRRHSTTIAIG